MTARRLWIVNMLLLGITAGSLIDIVSGREHWPFSPYAMYSRLELDRTARKIMVFGVPEDLTQDPFPLQARQFIRPFERTRLNTAMSLLYRSSQGERNIRLAAKDIWRRYSSLRRTKLNAGPRLKEVRVYEVWWQLRADASNVRSPDRKRLLAIVTREELDEPDR